MHPLVQSTSNSSHNKHTQGGVVNITSTISALLDGTSLQQPSSFDHFAGMPKLTKPPPDLHVPGQQQRPTIGRRRTNSDEKNKKTSLTSAFKHGITQNTPLSPILSRPVLSLETVNQLTRSYLTPSLPAYVSRSPVSNIGEGKMDAQGNDDTQTKSHDTSNDVDKKIHAVRGGDNERAKEIASPSTLVTTTTPQEEIERLRAAMNAQILLTQQRDKLSKELIDRSAQPVERAYPVRGKSRVSPIHEEERPISPSLDAAFSSPMPTGMETASTESGRTVKGGSTPGPYTARTPSYPFPSMKGPKTLSFATHKPFTALSPTTFPSSLGFNIYDTPTDRVTSGTATPASTATFLPRSPAGTTQVSVEGEFKTPSLYELSLMLSSEPGLEPWWNTVCQVMKDAYGAERVSLSVPADTTDIENVPWGQKATYNTTEEDSYSLSYLPRGSSLVPSSAESNEHSNFDFTDEPNEPSTPVSYASRVARPDLMKRHSFTAYEDTKRAPIVPPPTSRPTAALRQPSLSRSQSYMSSQQERVPRKGTLRNAELNLASLEEHLAHEATKPEIIDPFTCRDYNNQGRVFPVLQALDYEADALIDSVGILRVLERGKVIVLTRDYPYLEDGKVSREASNASTKPSKTKGTSRIKEPYIENDKLIGSDSTSRRPPFLGKEASGRTRSSRTMLVESSKGVTSVSYVPEITPETQPMAKFEEYEQIPPSPWAQSPAPSPAVRADPSENPFFTDINVEDSFNPTTTPQDYSKAIEAIGIDRSCTVLHIPFIHPLLSKAPHATRLDTVNPNTVNKDKHSHTTESNVFASGQQGENSRQKHSPIAILSILTSTTPYPSNLRHSLQHLAPHLATSFSLARHYSNLESENSGLSRKRPTISGFGAVALPGTTRSMFETGSEMNHGSSNVDSVTSPSDYSGVSRSPGPSPSGTSGDAMDRVTGNTPGYSAGDSYFTARLPTPGRGDAGSGANITGDRRLSNESFPDSVRGISRSMVEDTDHESQNVNSPEPQMTATSMCQAQAVSYHPLCGSAKTVTEETDHTRKKAIRKASNQEQTRSGGGHVHTQLHSYGADFASTFQSLPTTASQGPLRLSSSGPPPRDQVEMPTPSERVKNLMLDTLPAHLFVALPQTGAIVWVNNRYLTYRGQTIAELKDNPWGSIHPDELEIFLKEWSHSLRTGEQFSMQVRIKRFDGNYRWFYTRAVGGRDTRGVIVQWYGSYMDIHDQHIAEVKAARQEEIETSEAKHRLLANLIPQIIFAATEEEGVNFANERWLSYTGQSYEDALGLGFMDFVHPEDLAKCRIPTEKARRYTSKKTDKPSEPSRQASTTSSSSQRSDETEATIRAQSRRTSMIDTTEQKLESAHLSDLTDKGIFKVTKDNDDKLSYTTEVRLLSKNNEYRWHLVRCVQVDNINFGSGDGSWFGACTDINDHKILEAALKDAMDSKSKFLSNMSHEIRTPLIGISGMVAFLQDTVLSDEQSDYANTISTSASSLLMIINDILDISKVDSGMMKLNFEWFHPSSLIEDVHELISTLAIQKKVELNYVVDTEVPSMVKGDKFRIRQVLLNVVGNAIKFTQEGEVFTSCKVFQGNGVELGRNEIMLIWSVQDTGPGFDEEQKKKMFKPFSQLDGSLTRAHGGTGLGLVISRTLVELHGGHMDGTGVPGKGATFTFTIRLRLPSSDDQPPLPVTPMPESLPDTPVRRPSLASAELTARAIKLAGGAAIPFPNIAEKEPPAVSPQSEMPASPVPTFMSSASSDPSILSSHAPITQRSSASSINPGLSHFQEAANNSQTDLTTIKLALPEKGFMRVEDSPPLEPRIRPKVTDLHRMSSGSLSGFVDIKPYRPSMYSILIVCPQRHSREATARHIEMTLPKDVPSKITSLDTAQEAREMIGGSEPILFTHIILNLGDHEAILLLVEEIFGNIALPQTSIVVLSDPVQRQLVMKTMPDYDYDQLAKDNRLNFIFKPVKPSRFAVIFDPARERDLSTDRNRSNAQQQVVNQKQNYIDAEKRLGNKGHKILLVEDNLVNQKVLLKYLAKVGVDVDLANDGVECTEMLFAQKPGFYSLILCDLQMPRKDGYQTCRDIREWEERNKYVKIPIIALSANVMSDVLEKCNEAGFNSYVTKPVDFKSLSATMGNLLELPKLPLSSPALSSPLRR